MQGILDGRSASVRWRDRGLVWPKFMQDISTEMIVRQLYYYRVLVSNERPYYVRTEMGGAFEWLMAGVSSARHIRMRREPRKKALPYPAARTGHPNNLNGREGCATRPGASQTIPTLCQKFQMICKPDEWAKVVKRRLKRVKIWSKQN